MTYAIVTHDAWGTVEVGRFTALEQAREAFGSLCADPWYRSDGTVKGVELLALADPGPGQRVEWFSFQELS